MTFTAEYRAKLIGQWRDLAIAAIAADPAGLIDLARAALDWPSPFKEKGESFVLFSLRCICFAHVQARTPERRAAQRPALSMTGQLAYDLLVEAAPPPDEPPPATDVQARLPYADH